MALISNGGWESVGSYKPLNSTVFPMMLSTQESAGDSQNVRGPVPLQQT